MNISPHNSSYAHATGAARRVIKSNELDPSAAVHASHAPLDSVANVLMRPKTEVSGLCLPPPKAPKAPITARTEAIFASLSRSVDDVLNVLQLRAPRINFQALTPEIPADVLAEEAPQVAQTMAKAATASLVDMGRQFASLSGGDMFVAFMMLRQEAHGHGLHINAQLAEMASAVRHAQQHEQQALNREAALLLDRAVTQQAKLGRTGLWLEGFTAVASCGLSVLMATSGVGLALSVGAIGIGFAAGGVAGAEVGAERFNLRSALRGASVGASVVPLVETLGMFYTATGHLGGVQLPAWAAGMPQRFGTFVAEQSPAALQSAGRQVLGVFEHIFEQYLLSSMMGLRTEARLALWASIPVMNSVGDIYRMTQHYRITQLNLQARTKQTLGRMCAQAGREAQERWKNTQNLLSGMQESRSQGLEQIMRMMNLHHQTLLRCASSIR